MSTSTFASGIIVYNQKCGILLGSGGSFDTVNFASPLNDGSTKTIGQFCTNIYYLNYFPNDPQEVVINNVAANLGVPNDTELQNTSLPVLLQFQYVNDNILNESFLNAGRPDYYHIVNGLQTNLVNGCCIYKRSTTFGFCNLNNYSMASIYQFRNNLLISAINNFKYDTGYDLTKNIILPFGWDVDFTMLGANQSNPNAIPFYPSPSKPTINTMYALPIVNNIQTYFINVDDIIAANIIKSYNTKRYNSSQFDVGFFPIENINGKVSINLNINPIFLDNINSIINNLLISKPGLNQVCKSELFVPITYPFTTPTSTPTITPTITPVFSDTSATNSDITPTDNSNNGSLISLIVLIILIIILIVICFTFFIFKKNNNYSSNSDFNSDYSSDFTL